MYYPRDYTQRDKTIEAVKFNRYNHNVMREFCGDKWTRVGCEGIIELNVGPQRVVNGDYIVKNEFGNFAWYKPEAFRERYMLASEII